METTAQRTARAALQQASPARTSHSYDGPERRRRRRRHTTRRGLQRAFGASPATQGLFLALVVVVALLIVRPVFRSILSYHRTSGLLAQRRIEVDALKARQQLLERQIDYFNTDAYIAARAREFGMVSPGEVPLVVREFDNPTSYGKLQQITDTPPAGSSWIAAASHQTQAAKHTAQP